jgi:hypothetical protein
MQMLEKPLGNYVFEHIRSLEIKIEKNLAEISTENEDWALSIDYSFQLSEEKRITDKFVVTVVHYIADEKRGKFAFEFQSIETLFLNEICEIMYAIVYAPGQADEIVNSSRVTLKFLS